MYAWRNLQSKNIVAAFFNLRGQEAHQDKKPKPEKVITTKTTSSKLHSV